MFSEPLVIPKELLEAAKKPKRPARKKAPATKRAPRKPARARR